MLCLGNDNGKNCNPLTSLLKKLFKKYISLLFKIIIRMYYLFKISTTNIIIKNISFAYKGKNSPDATQF